MNRKTHRLGLFSCALALLGLAITDVPAQERTLVPGGPRVGYQVIATGGRVIRDVMGPVTSTLRGVPAVPVDSFSWDGQGVTPVEGELLIDVDPIANTGTIAGRWVDEHGEWTYTQEVFLHPEYPSGVRIGSSVDERRKFLLDPIVTNVYLHGDTTAGQPVLPTLFAYLAAWGPAFVTLEGLPFENQFGLPSPLWLGHVMVAEGVRGEDGAIRVEGGGIYNPSLVDRGVTDPTDLEVHLVFHDERFPRTANIPPLHTFYYHLNFETVTINIRGIESPGRRSTSPGRTGAFGIQR